MMLGQNRSLFDDPVLGQFSEDVVKIGGVWISVIPRLFGRLVVDAAPDDAVVHPGRLRPADGEDQAAVEGLLEKLQHFPALVVVRQVGYPGKPDHVVGLAGVRMVRALKAIGLEAVLNNNCLAALVTRKATVVNVVLHGATGRLVAGLNCNKCSHENFTHFALTELHLVLRIRLNRG